jgi:hypothetical protein
VFLKVKPEDLPLYLKTLEFSCQKTRIRMT